MMGFAVMSFILHPVRFIRGWRRTRRLYDKDGYPKPGSGLWGDPLLDTEEIWGGE